MIKTNLVTGPLQQISDTFLSGLKTHSFSKVLPKQVSATVDKAG